MTNNNDYETINNQLNLLIPHWREAFSLDNNEDLLYSGHPLGVASNCSAVFYAPQTEKKELSWIKKLIG